MSDLSHKQKAAWEYDRDQVVFKPYKWEGRNISPNLPPTLANDVLVRVAGLEAPHPKLSLNTFVCRFTCFIVIPFTLGWTFFFLALVLHAQSEERQQKSKLVLFGALILMLVTSCLLVCKKRMGYPVWEGRVCSHPCCLYIQISQSVFTHHLLRHTRL